MEDIHKNHRERMFTRLKERGVSSFYDHELLEMLLYFSVPRIDTNPTAHRLLSEFKSMGGVLKADLPDLKGVNGVGDKTAILINIIGEILRRTNDKRSSSKVFRIRSTEEAVSYCTALFAGKKYEEFHAICLDVSGAVISDGLVCEGVIDQVPAYTRKILETALRHGAHKVVLSHNHPGGAALPSNDDDIITEKCKIAFDAMNISLNDHIIIGDNGYFSYAQVNKLKSKNDNDILKAAQKKEIIKELDED